MSRDGIEQGQWSRTGQFKNDSDLLICNQMGCNLTLSKQFPRAIAWMYYNEALSTKSDNMNVT